MKKILNLIIHVLVCVAGGMALGSCADETGIKVDKNLSAELLAGNYQGAFIIEDVYYYIPGEGFSNEDMLGYGGYPRSNVVLYDGMGWIWKEPIAMHLTTGPRHDLEYMEIFTTVKNSYLYAGHSLPECYEGRELQGLPDGRISFVGTPLKVRQLTKKKLTIDDEGEKDGMYAVAILKPAPMPDMTSSDYFLARTAEDRVGYYMHVLDLIIADLGPIYPKALIDAFHYNPHVILDNPYPPADDVDLEALRAPLEAEIRQELGL